MAGEYVLTIKLRVLDKETGESRICSLDEAQTWDWANPEIWRIISGWQITNFRQLLIMLKEKQEKGLEEAVLEEAPRFMMLSGG
jgi:hypothetical protein